MCDTVILTYIHTFDDIQKGVKEESSILARDKDNFEMIVFDEERLTLFRALFLDARANVTSACAAYMKDQVDYSVFEQNNYDTDRDFVIQLSVDGFITAMNDSVDIKMKAYLIAYIVYRWLETKLPEIASIYLTRSNTVLQDMKRFLEMRKHRRIRAW
jgi:hypothetical protein